MLKGKRVVVIDDSIVRGTTLAQDREDDPRRRRARGPPAHLARRRRSGPATTASTRRRGRELIASSHSVEEIARYVTADSLGYLSLEGLDAALNEDRKGFCDACLSGEYLLEFPHRPPAAMQLRIVGT